MSVFLGIDTSNYTTSLSLYDTASNRVEMEKRLLPVKPGQCGLRQSDAVFLHVKQLGELAETLFARTGLTPQGIGYSAFPRRVDGSYMPCFLVGEMAAQLLASAFPCRFIPFPIRKDTSPPPSILQGRWIGWTPNFTPSMFPAAPPRGCWFLPAILDCRFNGSVQPGTSMRAR